MLPIHYALPALLTALRARSTAVLIAPPGAGKTTAVAPALLAEPWCTGEILLLSPRRLAARAAAERMAALAAEPVGRTFGYMTRLDAKRSAATRVLVLTEGIFRNRILADPELAGVSAVLFDEVHERSLDGDFGLALALDAAGALRPDLRLIAMSATLDGVRFARLMGDAPVIESAGRSFPLELVHLGRDTTQRIEDAMVAAIRLALGEAEGGLLAFLPGVAEIERTAERLDRLPHDVDLHRLHGAIDPAAQRAAIAPAPPGRRKLILATSIAETSLTLDGVRIVVDSGLARRPRYDRAAGLTRLATERVSQAAATQRAGRAARQAPGVAYRLWEAAATPGLPLYDPPEILEADLSPLLLDCALWGERDPARLAWLDPPPASALAEARMRLAALGAIDDELRPTPHGRAIAALPLPPRLAHMLVAAEDRTRAAETAVLLSERGLGGSDIDLETRLRRWRNERGGRAEAARGLAKRWAALVLAPLPAREGIERVGHAPGMTCDMPGACRTRSMVGGGLAERVGLPTPGSSLEGRGESLGRLVALAFPDRVAKRRDGSGEHWSSIGGRGFRLGPASPLASSEWLAIAEAQGAASGARILAAAAITQAEVEEAFGNRIAVVRRLRFDPATGAVEALRERRLGAVRLSRGPDDAPNPDEIAAALQEGVRRHGLALLPWSETAAALRARAAFARDRGADLPSLDDAALTERLDTWLQPLLAGRRRLETIPEVDLLQALQDLLGWEAARSLDRLAPAEFFSTAGSRHAIDYAGEGAPIVELRVQALFGLAAHPEVMGVPLLLRLTSPAGRAIQATRDLPGFWAGSWREVVKEMRGRYPRHPWPDDPVAADPTLRTKKADARARS